MTVTLYGKKGSFAGVRDLRMGRLSWIIGVGPQHNPMCPNKREAEEDEKTLALKTEMMRPPAKEGCGHQELEEAVRDGSSPGAWG